MLQFTGTASELPQLQRLLRIVLIHHYYRQHSFVHINAGHYQLRFHAVLLCRGWAQNADIFWNALSRTDSALIRLRRTITSTPTRSRSNSLSASTSPLRERPRVHPLIPSIPTVSSGPGFHSYPCAPGAHGNSFASCPTKSAQAAKKSEFSSTVCGLRGTTYALTGLSDDFHFLSSQYITRPSR